MTYWHGFTMGCVVGILSGIVIIAIGFMVFTIKQQQKKR